MKTPLIPLDPDEFNHWASRPSVMHSDIVELQRLDREFTCRVDGRLRRTMHWSKEDDRVTGDIIVRARLSIYGKQHPDQHITRFPADWWQALKERFAPAWFRDRWPVQFTEVRATLEELYPDIEAALPDRSPVMRFHVKRALEHPIF